jgi:hypothetical protein
MTMTPIHAILPNESTAMEPSHIVGLARDAEQLGYERRDHATADVQLSREIRARNGLMLTHQVEQDLTVDLTGRRPRRKTEIAHVDLPHTCLLDPARVGPAVAPSGRI